VIDMKKVVLITVVLSVVLSIMANLAVNQIMTNQNSILDGANQKHVQKIVRDYYPKSAGYYYTIYLNDVLGRGQITIGTYWVQTDNGEEVLFHSQSGIPRITIGHLETRYEYFTVSLVYADVILWSERVKVEEGQVYS